MKTLNELKCTIAVVETAQKNIDGFNSLKNRELAIIPTDSEYFKEFEKFIRTKRPTYDRENEKSPMFISSEKSNKILELLIKHQEDFANKFKEKIERILK